MAIGSESSPVQAASDGYGEGGYGQGAYGNSGAFSITTENATGVDATSMTLNGTLGDLDGAESAGCYFEWRQSGASNWNVTAEQTLSATGLFSLNLTGLEENTAYEYRAAGDASDGDATTGTAVTVSTADDRPAVTTDGKSDVTDSTVTLHGSLTDLGGATGAECSFDWRPVGADTWNSTAGQSLSAPESFSTGLSGLSSDTDYEYRAVVAATDGDTDTGGSLSFTTESSDTPPAIDSYSVTEAGSPNPHADITADWSVSDVDGDLRTVTVEVFDTSGSLVEAATTDVSGASATGTDTFTAKHARGQTFAVTTTVTDGGQNSTSATQSVSE